ncbi:diguanylate cyclase domain-containing protein [Enterobacter hormaechei]|uniref:diguanylate cyclase domain-containing protein n=1 Tax=Enterobacter hormaechei TaxID=158836 RepID=UPI003F8D8A0D
MKSHLSYGTPYIYLTSNQPGYHYALPVQVTLSIGVCSAIQNNVNSNDIMRDVDEALYEAKHNGKNRIVTRQAECS